jgi:hypothetical protein
MTKTGTNSPSSSPTDSQRDALAKLQRIYGQSSIAPNLFGRRPALPSEIQRFAAARQQPAFIPQEPSQRTKKKKRG